jgi:succinoglycan biosynthesis transport protein ExoP
MAVLNLRNQKDQIRNNILDELHRIAESYKSELKIAKIGEKDLQNQLSEAVSKMPNEAEVSLHGLESSAQSYRKLYDNFLQHHTEAIQEQVSPFSEIKVVSKSVGAPKTFPLVNRVLALTAFGDWRSASRSVSCVNRSTVFFAPRIRSSSFCKSSALRWFQ